MIEISAISAALSSLKAAKDIAEAMIGLRDSAAFQSKLIEFQSKIIDANNAAFAAQDERAALLEKIRGLEKQVAGFEAWEAEKQKYELKAFGDTAFAYSLRENTQPPETPHWLCTKCYQRRQKSILQKIHHDRECVWSCSVCAEKLLVPYTIWPGHIGEE